MTSAGPSLHLLRDLQASRPYLRLLKAMPVMLWTADDAGVWHHVNRRWAEYTGLTDGLGGFGFEAALHPDDVAPTVARWRQSIESGEPYAIEYRIRGRGGEYRWFLIRGVRVVDEAGQGIAWVGTCTDIEAQKRAEQEALAAREAALRALGLALEARDRETQGHTDRVTAEATRLGRALGLGPEGLGELGFVPPAALELVRHHHERWDGGGYPDGLAGENIPLLARLFAVVDVYDALLSERPYKRAWTREEALAELRAQAGHQLDPRVVAAFLGLLGG
ncbi:putative PAS/PAC sensor protein [Deinococcus aerius]|uniref:Putative PAS/PAC sensor protein n=1 Tax=Deinococcus aerius TaxID=200253 RepID=A0A2I9DN55_9DEIO|nr:HD domain-containing phosphohydrolase [Deinococcus aerius]GBF06481.1 putative PAS/PAC sensor protein [Deinococcus aerius]